MPGSETAKFAGRRLIMGIDDDPLMLNFLAVVVRGQNMLFVSAESALDAIPIIKRDQPDLIFLDINMQGTSGLELCASIRKNLPDYPAPIVFLTADHSEKVLEKALAAGGDDYVVKPVSPENIVARLNRWLPDTGPSGG